MNGIAPNRNKSYKQSQQTPPEGCRNTRGDTVVGNRLGFLTFTYAGFLAEVVTLWALTLETPKSVDAVSTLAEPW